MINFWELFGPIFHYNAFYNCLRNETWWIFLEFFKRVYTIEGKSCKEIIGKERDGISNLDPSNPIFFHEYDTRLTRLYVGNVRFHRLLIKGIGFVEWNPRMEHLKNNIRERRSSNIQSLHVSIIPILIEKNSISISHLYIFRKYRISLSKQYYHPPFRD